MRYFVRRHEAYSQVRCQRVISTFSNSTPHPPTDIDSMTHVHVIFSSCALHLLSCLDAPLDCNFQTHLLMVWPLTLVTLAPFRCLPVLCRRLMFELAIGDNTEGDNTIRKRTRRILDALIRTRPVMLRRKNKCGGGEGV